MTAPGFGSGHTQMESVANTGVRTTPAWLWLVLVTVFATGTLRAQSDAPPGPRLVVRQEDYDFGKMETDNAGQHEFVFANVGDQPVTLQVGKETCGCCTCACETRLPDGGQVPSHASAAVTLQWTVKRFTGAYHQTATILTNDPRRPEVMLAVSGRIVPAVRVVPGQCVFSSLLVGATASGEVRVYGYRAEPLKINDCRFSDPASARFFETAIVPLSAEEVAQEPDARNGFAVRVTLRPGLPVGPFRQDLVLATSLGLAAKVEIPVQGRITSPVSVAGPGWDSRAGLLKLPPIDAQAGMTRSLLLLVRGPHCQTTTFRLVRVVPACLTVELGETQAAPDGESTRTPLVIRIPAGSPPGSYLGPPPGELGQIVIETNHPQQPQLRLLVSFAIKE